MKQWLFFGLLGLVLTGCSNNRAELAEDIESNISFYKGVWEVPGYGYLVSIDDSGLSVFDRAGLHCLPNYPVTEHLPQNFSKLDNDTFQTSYSQYSTNYLFRRLNLEIDDICLTQSDLTKKATFDYFTQLMSEHYAFFELYGVNWSERVRAAKTKIHESMTDRAFFAVLTSMLKDINDAHLYLIGEIEGQELTYTAGQSKVLRNKLDRAFNHQSEFTNAREFRRNWYRQHKETISNKLLTKQYHSDYDDQILWGTIGDIGYINFLGMRGFSENNTIQQELENAKTIMDTIFVTLKDTEALIIDVSTNSGGNEELSLLFAGYFIDKEKVVYTKQAHGFPHSQQVMTVTAQAGHPYQGKVYLVTSDHTVSAAENFVMAMKTFPNVTIVGDVTRGAFSDVLDKSLPNGWQLGLSNEVYKDINGANWEGKGIPPDVHIPIFSRDSIFTSHAESMREIIQLIDEAMEG